MSRSRKSPRRRPPHYSPASNQFRRRLQAHLQSLVSRKPEPPALKSFDPITDPGCILWAIIGAACFLAIALKTLSQLIRP